MHEQSNEELYRIPNEAPISYEQMGEDEVELRKILTNYSKDPRNPETLIQVTRILMRRNLYDEARLYLDPYLGMAPDDPEALNYDGIIRFTQADFLGAEKSFDQALAQNADHVDALYNSAMLYSERGDFTRARKQFEKLTQLEQQNPEVFNNLGALLYQNGEWEEAEKRFKEALGLDAENSTALRNLIEVLIERGRWEEAESHLAAYERTNPEQEDLEAVKHRLAGESMPAPAASNDRPDAITWSMPAVSSGEGGMRVGIVSDWCPGDRGELAWWLWSSLKENGHDPYVLSWTGKAPHCKGADRPTQPRYLGRWAVPNFSFCEQAPPEPEWFQQWLAETRPEAVIFVDHTDPWMLEACHAAGAAAIGCPALVGASKEQIHSCKAYDAVITASPWIRKVFDGQLPADRVIPCDLGIDHERFSPRGGDKRETVFLFDAGYGGTEDLENLLLVLTAFGMMNHESLERSRLLIRTHVDWYLLPEEIRSRGEGQFRIDVLSGQMENAHFLGLGDVLLHLKLSSGVHWVVPEAAACGVPSIIVDGSPADGWIFDEKMILRVPRTADLPQEQGRTQSTDAKILADTLSKLATDPEMVAYMGGVCREKTRLILEGNERSRVVCDKIITATLAWKNHSAEAPSAATMDWNASCDPVSPEPGKLLGAIDKALSQGNSDAARELISRYKQKQP